MLKPLTPIHTVNLLPGLSQQLLSVLKSLTPEDWEAPTACPGWSVKDVASHLLGGNIGRLAHQRDRIHRTKRNDPSGYRELVAWINQMNAEWIEISQRFSPPLLIDFLELTDRQVYQFFLTLDPDGKASVPVSWAGEVESKNWFDTAREYTEKWLHQQHIREAVGQLILADRRWLHPVLDTFLRGLPYAYREVEAREGTQLAIHIVGRAGSKWSLLRQEQGWKLFSGSDVESAARVILDQDLAWRLFTKGISMHSARQHLKISGNLELGEGILNLVSIIA